MPERVGGLGDADGDLAPVGDQHSPEGSCAPCHGTSHSHSARLGATVYCTAKHDHGSALALSVPQGMTRATSHPHGPILSEENMMLAPTIYQAIAIDKRTTASCWRR